MRKSNFAICEQQRRRSACESAVRCLDSLQDIRQNHWTVKYRSQRSTFNLRSNVRSYWTIIPNYHVQTSNSLQDIRQNHWTVKYRSCWPSLHDPQINVTRSSHVWQTICISYFQNRFVEIHILKVSKILTSSPHRDMNPGASTHDMEADPLGDPWSKYECFLMGGWKDIPT